MGKTSIKDKKKKIYKSKRVLHVDPCVTLKKSGKKKKKEKSNLDMSAMGGYDDM